MSEHDPGAMEPASSLGAESAPSQIAYRFLAGAAVITRPDSIEAESIRSLRTHLSAQHLRAGRRSLAICAPREGAGCSFVAVNLALAMAQSGVKTLLVDANLRDPGVDRFIEPVMPGPGLYHCLTDTLMPLGQAVREDVLPNFSMLYAGAQIAGSDDLISGREFKTVMELCVREYDLTIVDTPPSGLYADARRIAAVMSNAMVVARRNTTFVSDLRLLTRELQGDRATVIGSYLNDY